MFSKNRNARLLTYLAMILGVFFAVPANSQNLIVKKTARPHGDAVVAALPNQPINYIGTLGVTVKILSASIAADGTITAEVTIKDGGGVQPLDRLGVYSAGPVTLSFIAGTIPAGQSQYVSYTTAVAAATINNNPSQIQPAFDSGGTFTQNAIGDYTYTFHTRAPTGFDATATHSIGVTASRNLSAFGTFDTTSESGNDIFTFVPNGTAVSVTRSIVATAACNNCHNPVNGHGGSRLKVELCVMCHTPQNVNPDTGLSMNMPVLIHKIHRGASLPSVVAGTPYRIWHRGAWSDFSTVVFPQDIRNCTQCHTGGAKAQVDNWKTNPSRAACGACHDDVDFSTGKNHVNLPQFDDNECKDCHTNPTQFEFDASITGAHTVPGYSTALPGIVLKIISVTNTAPGSAPLVTFTVNDKKGNVYDITKLTTMRVVLGGPNTDYQTGPGAIRVSETPTTAKLTGGQYTYTMTNKIPAAAAGSYTISLQAANNVTLSPGTVIQQTAVDSAAPVEYYFSIDKSALVARRQVVANANCQACHRDLTFVHGGSRASVTECPICHNPSLVDTSKATVHMAGQIHSIHRGQNLTNPYILGSTNYQSVRFPGDLRACTTCHLPNTYQTDKIGAVAAISTPGGFTPTTLPTAAACQGCHDDQSTAAHALANTNVLGETCSTCHGTGKQFAVDAVHAR